MAIGLVLNRRSQAPAEDSPAFGAIAERFRRAGELERAVALCQEGLLKFPEHLSARVTMGWALLDLGRHREAQAELERVIKRAPDNLAAIRGLAQLHDRMENADASDLQNHSAWQAIESVPEAPAAIHIPEPVAVVEVPRPVERAPVAFVPVATPESSASEAVADLAGDLFAANVADVLNDQSWLGVDPEMPAASLASSSELDPELESFMRAVGAPNALTVAEESIVAEPAEPAQLETAASVAMAQAFETTSTQPDQRIEPVSSSDIAAFDGATSVETVSPLTAALETVGAPTAEPAVAYAVSAESVLDPVFEMASQAETWTGGPQAVVDDMRVEILSPALAALQAIPEPAVAQAQPVVAHAEPVIVQAEPVVAYIEPMVAQAQPVAAHVEPAVMQAVETEAIPAPALRVADEAAFWSNAPHVVLEAAPAYAAKAEPALEPVLELVTELPVQMAEAEGILELVPAAEVTLASEPVAQIEVMPLLELVNPVSEPLTIDVQAEPVARRDVTAAVVVIRHERQTAAPAVAALEKFLRKVESRKVRRLAHPVAS